MTDRVWEDWFKKRAMVEDLSRVVGTYKEYLGLTGGDSMLALKFLLKAYPAETVTKAGEWFPGEIPDDAVPARPTGPEIAASAAA